MDSELERLLQDVRGQSPSEQFRSRLRAQIVAETEVRTFDGSAIRERRSDTTDILFAEVIELESDAGDHIGLVRERTTPKRRFYLLGSAAAVLAIAAAVWMFNQDTTSEIATSDQPAEKAAAPTSTATMATAARQEDSTFDGEEGAPLTAGNTFIESGTFVLDTLGTSVTFEVEESVGVTVNENGRVALTALTSRNADDRTLTFRRTPVLPNPSSPTGRLDRTTGWPATDLLEWLANASVEVTADEPRETTLGGVPATSVEFSVTCGEASDCRPGELLDHLDHPMFNAGSRYQLWVVNQGDQDPIVVTVATDDDSDIAWLETAEMILASMRFGPVVPNPVRVVAAGRVELRAFDGTSAELFESTAVVESHPGLTRLLPSGVRGDIELMTRPLDIEGNPVESTERLLEVLTRSAVFVTEQPLVEVGGITARGFELDSGGQVGVILKTRTSDLVRAEFGWLTPVGSHLWVIEHPERGLLIVSEEPCQCASAEELGSLRDLTRSVLSSLEFRSS